MGNIPEFEADARLFTCRSEAVTCCFSSCPNALETYCRYDICFLLAIAVSGLKWFGLSGPCTLAVTTLATVPRGVLSTEVPQGPYPLYGYANWHSIWKGTRELLKSFLIERNQAGIIECLVPMVRSLWALIDVSRRYKHIRIGSLYATDSQIDKAIGPKANDVLILPGVNFTDSYSPIVSNAVAQRDIP